MIDRGEAAPNDDGATRNLVFVVDDHPLQRSEIAEYLRHKRFSVVEIADGALAIKEIDQKKPELVLMDVKMPGCDGVRAAEIVRSLSPKTKVVLISGYADEVVRAHCTDCGALAIMDKPLALGQLCRFVASLLGSQAKASLALAGDSDASTAG